MPERVSHRIGVPQSHYQAVRVSIGTWQSQIGNAPHGPKRKRYSSEFTKPLIMFRELPVVFSSWIQFR